MKISVSNGMFYITSDITASDIKLLSGANPKALKILSEDESKELFAVSYNEGYPCVGADKTTLTFGYMTPDKGLAVFSGPVPEGTAGAKDYVADFLGAIPASLAKLEKTVPDAAKAVKDARDKLIGKITLVGDDAKEAK